MSEQEQESRTVAHDAVETLIDLGANNSQSEANKASWYLAEGVPGEGEVPDYLIDSRFKTVEEQAKGYNELRKKLGAFTGAPDKYDVKLQDEFSDKLKLDTEDKFFKSVEQFAHSKGINNETFNELVNLYSMNVLQAEEQASEEAKQNLVNEHKKLGPEADKIISEVKNWTKSNVPEEYHNALQAVASTAEGIKFLDFVSKNVGYSKVPSSGDAESNYSAEQIQLALQKMMADKRYGQDQLYTKMVDNKYLATFG